MPSKVRTLRPVPCPRCQGTRAVSVAYTKRHEAEMWVEVHRECGQCGARWVSRRPEVMEAFVRWKPTRHPSEAA